MLLGHVVGGREMVDVQLRKAAAVASAGKRVLRVEARADSPYETTGATALIAKSTGRDFSPATGIEGLEKYGPVRGKNELGADYGNHDWVFKKPDGSFINPFQYPESGFFARYPMKRVGGENSGKFVLNIPYEDKYSYAVLVFAWDTWRDAPEESARHTASFSTLEIVNEKPAFHCSKRGQ